MTAPKRIMGIWYFAEERRYSTRVKGKEYQAQTLSQLNILLKKDGLCVAGSHIRGWWVVACDNKKSTSVPALRKLQSPYRPVVDDLMQSKTVRVFIPENKPYVNEVAKIRSLCYSRGVHISMCREDNAVFLTAC